MLRRRIQEITWGKHSNRFAANGRITPTQSQPRKRRHLKPVIKQLLIRSAIKCKRPPVPFIQRRSKLLSNFNYIPGSSFRYETERQKRSLFRQLVNKKIKRSESGGVFPWLPRTQHVASEITRRQQMKKKQTKQLCKLTKGNDTVGTLYGRVLLTKANLSHRENLL